MLVATALFATFLIVGTTHASASPNQDSRLVGCYDVNIGPWSGDARPLREPFFTVQKRVNLTSVRSALETGERLTYVMRAAPLVPESGFEDATWSADLAGKDVLLRWATPTFGIEGHLTVERDSTGEVHTLTGVVSHWTDHPPGGGSRADVKLVKVNCFSPL